MFKLWLWVAGWMSAVMGISLSGIKYNLDGEKTALVPGFFLHQGCKSWRSFADSISFLFSQLLPPFCPNLAHKQQSIIFVIWCIKYFNQIFATQDCKQWQCMYNEGKNSLPNLPTLALDAFANLHSLCSSSTWIDESPSITSWPAPLFFCKRVCQLSC